MIILIPIGGIGTRFKNNNYKKPKALINIFGKPMLFYLLDNLNVDKIDYIIIPYNKEYEKYNFEETIKKHYSNIKFKFCCLNNNTKGAVETINIALDKLNEERDLPIISLDCDNFYLCDIISQWNGENCVFSFKDIVKNPIYSYIECNGDNIINIKEKDKISNLACTGAYGFKSIKKLKEYTEKIISKNIIQKGEFYMSCVIKEMIRDKYIFINKKIDENNYICLGTPIQLKLFYNNYPIKSSLTNKNIIEKKRICFDLDNTLVTFPVIPNDYSSVKPIKKNIELLKYLKKFNNTIIIYTARRMRTHKGNVGKIIADIGKITFETLDKFDIPYDEIYFGKPNADFYIDDLAVNCFEDIEKEIGYYNNIIQPRDFNTIEINNVKIITKSGKNLDGEIYFYENIPNTIKDMFPIFLSKGTNTLNIEKINGITLNELYLSELLIEDTFIHILNSICRLHNIIEENGINIYENYSNKLIDRYNSYDYSLFENAETTYNELLLNLNNYESNNNGDKTCIHGDPVFTNILINNYGKIKFIDMRGKQRDVLTIYGDRFYDWAKIYQSLIGYDEILMSKKINKNYKNNMINKFKLYFLNKFSLDDFENVKLITKSLLFTLIPLHDNKKCTEYYKLIFSNYLN